MARLPLELQSYIFVFVDSQSLPQKPDLNEAPILFLRVCRLWRDIALATPILWTQLQIDSFPCQTNYLEACAMWLKRARSLPLSVTLRGALRLDKNLQDLLAQCSPRLKDLTLVIDQILVKGPTSSEIMWKMPERSLASLKTLSIEPTGYYTYGYISEWLDILRAAPRLSHCKMINTLEDPDVLPLQPLMLASLECMHLGEPGDWNLRDNMGSNSLVILRYLTLPALKILTVSELDIADDAFLSFLSRSSPPLESLKMTLSHEEPWPESVVSRFLPLIPQLITLDLAAIDGDPILPFVDLLASSEVLPHLRTIVFRPNTAANIHYSRLLSMLKCRFTLCPTRLERFELNFTEYVDMPNEEVRVALQQLARDGLKIHIGAPGNNML
ncbi:hypothetical protein R3P38DRAFT_2960797 [Favolaschia claudopus]|uniref:F-box domain-containing protein n=1 Tax=Favolaschia claudopus TaxID=2862362 RepID=A0AAW0B8M1_9AGAR